MLATRGARLARFSSHRPVNSSDLFFLMTRALRKGAIPASITAAVATRAHTPGIHFSASGSTTLKPMAQMAMHRTPFTTTSRTMAPRYWRQRLSLPARGSAASA